MEIRLINNQVEWDSALKKANFSHFQQFWHWGEVLKVEGKQLERLAVVENGSIVACAQIEYMALPFGWQYALCTKGPAVMYKVEGSKYKVYELLAKYLKNKNCVFSRFEPAEDLRFKISNFRLVKTIDLSPATTVILDLTKPFDDILAGMEKKTRYGIRQAESKGVIVKQEKNFDLFWNLMQKTSSRQELRLHSKKHYELIFAAPNCRQLTAYKDTTPVAAALFWGEADTFTYLFAASDYVFHDLQAPYLIQKEAILLGQQLGFKKYDLFGIAPPLCHPDIAGGISVQSNATEISRGEPPRNDSKEYEYDRKHQYAGITKFKLGFGGAIESEPGTFDVVLKPGSYWLYSFIRKVRRLV